MDYLTKNKKLLLLSYVLIIAYFTNLLITTLAIGGGWDLNEQIAFGSRIINGTSTYANGITDLYFPSSPYFPGVGFLSALYNYIGISNIYLNNQVMLLTAVLIGIFYFILLKKLTLKLYPAIPSVIVTLMLTLLFVTHFNIYIGYMIEFKPDTILLVFATTIFLILEKDTKPKLLDFIIVGFILFISTFFKQSFFLVYFMAILSIYQHQYIRIKYKLILTITYFSIGLISLYFIFNITNLYYFTVDIMKMHPILDLKTIIYFFAVGFLKNMVFLIALIYFIIKNYKKNSLKKIQYKYFLFTLLWFLFSAVSTAKLGGNTGNFEVAIIVGFPFVIYTLHDLFKNLYTNIYFYRIILIVFLLLASIYTYKSLVKIFAFNKIIANNNNCITYLRANFKNSKVFIDGNTYILSKMADMNILTESETIAHFNNVPGYDMNHIKTALGNKTYDLIFVQKIPTYFIDKEIEKLMMKNYQILIDNTMPRCLQGKILIRREEE